MQDCHSAGPWGNVGTGSFVDILDTRENIARLARTDVCKIRALITFRVACIRGSAIYVRNLEVSCLSPTGVEAVLMKKQNKNTAYKCVNYKVHAEGLDRECFNQKLPWFGPAHVAGSKFAVIFVGSKC